MAQNFAPRPHNAKTTKAQAKALLIALGHKNIKYSGKAQHDKDGNVVRGPGMYYE
jgi:hypothetical protein